MTIDIDEVLEDFLQHRGDYNPADAHAYYMRTRELKGRKKGTTPPTSTALPKTQAGYPGQPHKLGTRMEEDMSPLTSPGGAKLTAYDQGSHNLGRATYSDGHVYDAKLGWIKPQASKAGFNAAQAKLDRVRQAVKKAPPQKRATLQKRVDAAQNKLDALKLQSRGSRANQ